VIHPRPDPAQPAAQSQERLSLCRIPAEMWSIRLNQPSPRWYPSCVKRVPRDDGGRSGPIRIPPRRREFTALEPPAARVLRTPHAISIFKSERRARVWSRRPERDKLPPHDRFVHACSCISRSFSCLLCLRLRYYPSEGHLRWNCDERLGPDAACMDIET
jgi:hypothetical protein